MIRKSLLGAALFFLSVAVYSAGAREDGALYGKKVLDNGAVVVAKYMPDSELVAVEIRVLSGLSNEGEYAGTGISHLVEHLLFKGTHNKNADQLLAEIRGMGAMINGSTGMDSAYYYMVVPRDKFRSALALLADMVMDLVFSDDELSREKDVISKEMRMYRDAPEHRLVNDLFAAAYTRNVYRQPIIGNEDLFRKLTRDDLVRYHARNYTPDKIVMGIAGAVPEREALRAAEEKLSGYKRGNPLSFQFAEEPAQLVERRSERKMETAVGYIAVGFHSPSMYSEEMYPLDVAGILLGDGPGSRLDKKLLKEKQLLHSVEAANVTPRYPGLFMVEGSGDPQKIEDAEKEIFAVIDEAIKGGFTDDEIERAKNMLLAEYIRSKQGVGAAASLITTSQIYMGEPSFYDSYIKKIQTVKKEDVLNAMKKYLRRDNSTVAVIYPEDFRVAAAAGEAASVSNERTIILSSGMRVLLKREPRLPIVSSTILFPGGVLAETAADNGISNLLAAMLVKGTKTRKEEDIEPVLNSLGGSIGGFSGKNSIGVNFQVLSLNQDKAWDIFEDVVKDPAFPDKELAIVKERILSAIKESSKSPSYEANRLLLKSLYGSHPYSMSEMGVALSVEPVTKADLQAFHYRYFNPQNAVMVVVGDIDLEVMAKRAEKMFGAWKAGDGKFESRPVDGIDGIKNAEITMDKEEAIVIVGYQGVTVYDPRKYPLAVISGILSGGGGLMFKVIREDNGLSYSCGAQATVSMDKGYFTLSAHTSEASVPKVEELIKKLAERIRRGDFKDEDIEGAKNRAITAYVSTFESIGELAKTLALVEFSGLGYKEFREYPENIRKVTKEDITRCAGELLDPTKCVIVVVHSSKKDVPK